jgi:Zn-dependent M28 family amino/carboxypeptidase
VIADSPKGKNEDETIIVGAYRDSVLAGPGIIDNGSGSSTILEIAEEMAELGYTEKLRRQVRFAFWGAEEFNLLGSEYYVSQLSSAQQAKNYANLNELRAVRLRRRRVRHRYSWSARVGCD